MSFRVTSRLLATVGLTVLAGCSGGGSAAQLPPAITPPPPVTPPPVTPPPVTPPPAVTFPCVTSSEYTRNWGVAATSAIRAWERGFTGTGVLVAVIDSGIDLTRQDLSANISPLSTDINLARNDPSDRPDDTDKHGTFVAGVIASEFNNFGTVGVAFRSRILSIRADIPGPCTDGCPFQSTDMAAALDYAIANGARIINLSIGGSAPLGGAFEAALRRAAAAGAAVVVSAGNNSAANPQWPARYATDPIYGGAVLAVGSLNEAGTISDFSARAGSSQNRYLVAPGERILTGCTGTSCWRVSGTSFAAPHVAGALALLKQASPALDGDALISILLLASDDLGDPGVDAIYGHGRLNIARAFQPIGPLSIPGGGSEIVPIGAIGSFGPAFGDAFERPGLLRTVGFDSFGRTFTIDAGDRLAFGRGGAGLSLAEPMLWETAQAGSGLTFFVKPGSDLDVARDRTGFVIAPSRAPAMLVRTALREDLALAVASGVSASESFAPAAFRGMGSLHAPEAAMRVAWTGGAWTASLGWQSGRAGGSEGGFVSSDGGAGTVTAQLAWRPAETLGFDATFGFTREDGGLLGGQWARSFTGAPSAELTWLALSAEWAVTPAVSIRAAAEAGAVRVGQGALFFGAGTLMTTAFSASAELAATPAFLKTFWPEARGLVSLSISQPLRIESGTLGFHAADADEWGRLNLVESIRSVPAAPSGREIRFGLDYRIVSGTGFEARLETAYRLDPGHVADASPAAEIGLRLAWRW